MTKRTQIAALTTLLTIATACAAFKSTVHTIEDIAQSLCQVWATENKDSIKTKISPQELCAINEFVQPFIDQILAAKQTAGGETKARLNSNGTSP